MCLLGVTSKPALSAGCDGILSLTRNLTYEQKAIRIADEVYSSYCRGSQLHQGSSFDADLNVVIQNVPFGLRLDSGSTREKVEHLCSNYQGWYAHNANAVSIARSTSDSAIGAWVRCKELEKQDVFFSVHPEKQLIGFSVKRGSDVIDFLGMIYNSDEMTCSGPFGEDAKQVVIDEHTRFTLQTAMEQPIVCRRNLRRSGNGTQHLAEGEVAIMAEGRPPLIVPLPREELYEPSYSSEIRESLKTLRATLSDTQERISKVEMSWKRQFENAIGNFDEFKRERAIKSILIMRGEHQRMGEPYFRTIWCGDASQFARDYCGDRPNHMEMIYQRSGDRCGYTYYVVSCVK